MARSCIPYQAQSPIDSDAANHQCKTAEAEQKNPATDTPRIRASPERSEDFTRAKVMNGPSYSSEGEGEDESEEAPPGSCPYRAAGELLQSHFWTAFVMSAIGANTAMMAVQCNYPDWPQWYIFEDGFLVFFIVEITLRLYVHRLSFFTSADERAWNIFELAVVISGVLDFILDHLLSPGKRGGQVMVMLRIVRIVRILRSCRLLKHFKQLYLLVQGFLHSLQAVFWIGVLFFLVVLIAGIIVTSLVGDNAEDWDHGPDREDGDVEEIKAKFGSLSLSMVTMFQLVTLDNWGDINVLVSKRMPLMTIFFILYILATAFAMIALLTGVITEHVTSVSQASEQAEEENQFREYVDTLEEVFRQADNADMGGLTFEEIRNLLQDPKVARKMELNPTSFTHDDLRDIFMAMDLSGDGRVNWEEFRHGVKDMHGPATAKEVALLRADLFQIRRLVGSLVGGTDLRERMTSLEIQVERMESTMHNFLNATAKIGSNS